MFAKKPPVPKAPWSLRVLTPDFVVDGYHDPDQHSGSGPFFSPEPAETTMATLWLDAPRFTPASPGAGAPPVVSQWLVPFTGSYVAVVPLDATSLAVMRRNVANYKHPFAAVLHVGPYAVFGQLLSDFDDVNDLDILAHHRNLAVQDATVEHRLPGAPFAGLQAPLVMFNGRWVVGIGLTK